MAYKKFEKKEKPAKVIENIKEYAKHKVLCEFKKKKSPQSGVFVEDMNDPWFVYAILYKTKSGIITSNSMTIKADYDIWVRAFERDGFELVIK
jgi:hypothetical protein